MILFFVLFMADYLLTYIGLQWGYIIEANPFMKGFMNLKLLPGTLLRTLLALLICYLLYSIKKGNIKAYRRLIGFVTFVLLFVIGLHAYWIYRAAVT
jgi:hypothetical protein